MWGNLFNKWQVKDFVLRFIQLWSLLVVTHVSASLDQEPPSPLCSPAPRSATMSPYQPDLQLTWRHLRETNKEEEEEEQEPHREWIPGIMGWTGSVWQWLAFQCISAKWVTWERISNIQQEGKCLHSQWRFSRGIGCHLRMFSQYIDPSLWPVKKKKISIISQHYLADSHFCLWLWDLVLFLFEKKNNGKKKNTVALQIIQLFIYL